MAVRLRSKWFGPRRPLEFLKTKTAPNAGCPVPDRGPRPVLPVLGGWLVYVWWTHENVASYLPLDLEYLLFLEEIGCFC